MAPKALPPAKINPIKLLGGSSFAAKKISVGALQDDNITVPKKDLIVIKTQVIKIKDLVKSSTLLKSAEIERKRKDSEKERFSKKEQELETPQNKEEGGKEKVPSLPKLGFLDRIKKFFFNVLLGYVVVRLLPHVNKLPDIVKTVGSAIDFGTDLALGLFNGLVTFIDWGYKAYDATRGFIKTIGGDSTLKVFDAFNGAVGKLIDAAIIAAIAIGGMGDSGGFGGGLRVGGKGAGRVDPRVARRYAERFGKDAALKKFGKEGIEKLGGKYARSGVENVARKAFVGLAGKGGAKTILKFIKPFTKRLPIIGGLIDFGLSVALGEDPGRAAFKAIGATLLGSVGAAVGSLAFGFGGIVGGILGSIGGDAIGGALYDMFFGGKKPTSKGKTTKAATGGPITRGGKVQGGVKRTVKKAKRSVKVQAPKVRPGASVGGEKKIEKVFPENKDTTKVNPLGYMKKSYDTLSSTSGFGGLFGIALKAQLGEKPSDLDYKIAASGLSAWMQNNLATGGAFAEGGSVDAAMFGNSEDMKNVIAKSLEETISKKVDDAINNLMKQLGLKPSEKPAGVPGPGQPGSTDMVNIQGGDADFWTLVAIASREDGEPQAWADVAQSIYNRLASGAYSGKTIKDLILGQMQYEPTWKYPRPGTTGKPNSEWYSIKDAASAGAAAGQSEGAMKKVAAAILDPTLQKNAREFIQGRTDFRGYSVSGGMQRKSGDNYFGWYNNYTANKIGSVPNFGATASTGPGPTEIALGKGYGSEGSKIAGELGKFIKQKLKQGPDFSQVHRHPEHPPYSLSSGHSRGSLHYQGRAVDIGAYSHEQGPILQVIAKFNQMKGIKPVQLLHAGNEPGGHSDHVHVAYAKGGFISKPTKIFAGERGREFMFDPDTTAAIEQTSPGLLAKLNYAKTKYQISNILKTYAGYEFGAEKVVEVPTAYSQPTVVPVPVPMGGGGMSGGMSGGSSDSSYDSLYM